MKNEYLESLLVKAENAEKLPFGTIKVLKAYRQMKEKDGYELEIEGGFLEDELEDAVETMKNADIESFRLFDSSSFGLMRTIYYLLAIGYKVEKADRFDKYGDKEIGLRFYK